jgi:hypothetical protein
MNRARIRRTEPGSERRTIALDHLTGTLASLFYETLQG